MGGAYYRYSDDILIVAQGDSAAGEDLLRRVQAEITKHGNRLKIKAEKSSLFLFKRTGDVQTCQLLDGEQGRNGLEYLGFRYDGKRVYIRDATLSNLRRKVARVARRDARAAASRYPTKGADYLRANYDYEGLIARFGRVADFGDAHQDYRTWTFWTYVTRAAKVFGEPSILRQLRYHRGLVLKRADLEIDRAITERDRKKL